MELEKLTLSPLRVLYLFAGERKKMEKEWREGRMPDSQLIGFNHLAEFGVKASYIENKFLNFVRKKNYNLPNLFLLPLLHRYDIIFSGASLFLPFVAKALFCLKRPKFVWYNTFFTNALKRNKDNRFRLWALRKTIASLDAVVCPSTAQRQFLIDQGFDPLKIFFVPNGIDVDFMKRKKMEQATSSPNSELFILSVGKDMGRDYATLSEAVSGLPIQVKVAALPRNFSTIKDVPENLQILGFVPFTDLVKLYQRSEFVVIPTKSEKHLDASDCSGQYVLLDSMSLGKAVVVSKRETLDYMENGREGIVVAPENPAELRVAITRLLKSSEERVKMGEAAGKKAAMLFTTKRLAGELSTIFKRLV